MTVVEKRIYTVSELTEEVKGLLEYNLDNINITGEISNFRKPSSGHYYFTLKDENAQIKAVMFRQTNIYLKFLPKDGMQVLGIGRLSVYPPQGSYQIILDYMEPTGIGALKQAFDDLKLRLKEEGLFDEERKKKLPPLIKKIGVVTSPTGAAIRDFISVATRRFSNIHVIIYPAKVQGKGAAEEIAEGIEYFNRAKNVDAIVITRGGGSFEDLFCFSEEIVARAVYRSIIPVISAVGHEIDTSISDFVADLVAPTPSAAAELIIARKDELEESLRGYIEKLKQIADLYQDDIKRRIDYCMSVIGKPLRLLDDLSLRVDDLTSHLMTLKRSNMERYRMHVDKGKEALSRAPSKAVIIQGESRLLMLQRRLKDLMREKAWYQDIRLRNLSERLELANPYNILKKGFSIVTLKDTEKKLTSVKEVKTGALLDVKLSEGRLECKVTKILEEK